MAPNYFQNIETPEQEPREELSVLSPHLLPDGRLEIKNKIW